MEFTEFRGGFRFLCFEPRGGAVGFSVLGWGFRV